MAQLFIDRIAASFFLGTILFGMMILPETSYAAWNISVDGDLRYRWTEGGNHDADIHAAGAAVRKTFADNRGDRVILFGLLEAEDNFSELSLHELYVQYKGPLGASTVTAGRFALPWGLLTGFSASRLLYDMPHDTLLGMDMDSGIKVSGVTGDIDYAISITQGYGHHQTPREAGYGLSTARIGLTLGDTEEIMLGVSCAIGRSLEIHDRKNQPAMEAMNDLHHNNNQAVRRAVGGVDATFYWGRWLGRMEFSRGRVDHRSLTAAFAALDYAFKPRLELNLSVKTQWRGTEHEDSWFAGFTATMPWFTLRGGYGYADHNDSRHRVIFQLYRMFSFAF